jgi:hypothetical protein
MKFNSDPRSDEYDAGLVDTARVFLNDVHRPTVIYADDGTGLAKYFRTESNGMVALDPLTHRPIVDSFFGKVRIEIPDEIRRRLDRSAQDA